LRGVHGIFGNDGRLTGAVIIQPVGEILVGKRQHGGGRREALMAPALPMASVPTGMPAGICTME